ncbi:MAG: ATP-binding protein [Stellaceae bacterium]
MRPLIYGKDWSKTPIGAIEQWSPTLKTIVDFLLANRFPHLLWWGPEYISIYNDAYRPILGTKHPWALGLPFREVWPEIQAVLTPLIDAPFNGGPATWMEDIPLEINRYGFPEETHFTIAYSPVPDDTAPRGIGGVLATVHEITEKIVGERRIAALRDLGVDVGRTAEEACTLAARALQSHDKDIPFALIYLLDGGEMRLVATMGVPGNEAAETIRPVDGAGGWPFAEVLSRGAAITIEKLTTVMASPPPGPWSDPPQSAVVLPLRSSANQPLAGFLIAGVSPRLRLDDQYRDFLNLVAAQVSAAIANARAYQEERKRAEALAEIDRAKTLFFSNVSHEFRTPLSLIIGPITNALDNAKGLAGTQLELAHRNSLRLLKLVNSLLDFSRIEAGRAEAAYVATDLSHLTAELASNFRSACERAGLRLSVDCPPLSGPVHVDRDMWEKIVLNLVSNAFKFTFDGGIEVAVGEAGGFAELVVRDTGVGIPRPEIGRLFERFYRIEGQRGRTHEGSGIGLALVQELVKLHGGTIEVDSAVGRGTVFTVRVPLGTAHLPSNAAGAQPRLVSTSVRADAFVHEALRWLPGEPDAGFGALDEAEETEVSAELRGGGRVLLADDNADMREYIRRLLGARCEVRTVADGRAALHDIREHRPNLVLADIMMPDMDGFELLREIRGDAALQDIPVILLSARAGEESRVQGLAAGANDYLVKPFAARELIARVSANLELARVRSEATAALRELNESLARRVDAEVGERMKVEETLRQAQKMEAIGHLTGGIAHDFNNLLQVVLGNLDGLKRRIDASDMPSRSDIIRAVEGAMRGAERAASLTQRLLAFSRRQPLEPRPLDVNRLVTGMSELLRRTLGESIAIETMMGDGLWRVFADPSQLENATLNLAVNARDAMPEGGKLTIESANAHLDEAYTTEQQELEPGQYVMLAISDTGIGMTKDVVVSAFDPFFTTKEVGHGTGLGLSQVYGFVKQSNGHVRIYSEPGEGTTVRIYLPRLLDESAVDEDTASGAMPSGDGTEIVLLVEDDDAVRDLNGGMLRELNYAVIEANDGVSALQILEIVPNIRVLFTDVGLPGGMNGRQLAEAALRLRPHLRVLFTTGYARNALVHHGRLDPGIELISKPFPAAALAVKLRELLDRA